MILISYQQSLNLQRGHVIRMEPRFFSIGCLHPGHGLELANILCIVIECSYLEAKKIYHE